MFMCLKVLNCQAASSANGDLDEAAANETTGILNDINGDFLPHFGSIVKEQQDIKTLITFQNKAALLWKMI